MSNEYEIAAERTLAGAAPVNPSDVPPQKVDDQSDEPDDIGSPNDPTSDPQKPSTEA